MFSKGGHDFVTGIYRIKDPIKNFKIKVKLKQEKTTLIPLPDFEFRRNENPDNGAIKGIEYEEKLISWQEKIFSPFEISYYGHSGNCHNPLEEKYHNEVTALFKDAVPVTRIFTYIDADNFIENDQVNKVTTENKPLSTILEKGMSVHHRRRHGHNKTLVKDISLANRPIVDYSPTEEARKKRHFLQSAFQTQYILADLSTRDSSEKEDLSSRSEYVLCTIKYDADTDSLFVTPDFSSVALSGQSNPYFIEVDGDSRNVYQYWLEHASEPLFEEDKEKEEAILSQLLDRQLDLRQMKVGTDFDIPHSNAIMMYIFGEVVCAEDFEYDDLFVHFLYELPKGWSCDNLHQLSGVTQKCRTNGTGMAYFGHLFETQLRLKVESLPVEADSVPCWPQFFAEVLSFDSWGRFRVEGYCYIKVPPNPGLHYFTLCTWRPLTNGPSGELRRFFVGGSPGLEDLSSVGIPATFEGERLSKLGLQAISSGTLHLRFNIVQQSSTITSEASETENLHNQNHPSFLLERISATSIVNSVNSVMAAFKRARERMLQAREGLDV